MVRAEIASSNRQRVLVQGKRITEVPALHLDICEIRIRLSYPYMIGCLRTLLNSQAGLAMLRREIEMTFQVLQVRQETVGQSRVWM